MISDNSKLYPVFGGKGATGVFRLQRLETGSQRLQRGQLRFSSGNYNRLPASVLGTRINFSQFVDLSHSNIRKHGGVSVSGNTSGFAYTATTTTITWYWDGTNGSLVPVIKRADGSSFTVPTAGSGLHITGLTPSTTYYFLPFWNVNNLCNIGWVPGTVGTPQIAFVLADTVDPINNPIYAMEQTLQGNEALSNGYMTAATTAAGTGGGGAGGGGSGGSGCVKSGTEIETLGSIPYTVEVRPETQWVYLKLEDGRDLFCTYDHPLYHALNGKLTADSFSVGDIVLTDHGEQKLTMANFVTRNCSKWIVRMKEGHLFYANGFLSHNKVNPK